MAGRVAVKNKFHLKGVYGAPLAKLSGQSIPLTRAQLLRVADIMLKSVKKEIKRDLSKVSGIRGASDPVPLPKTARFIQSFTATLTGKSTIVIQSDWPTASAHTTKLKSRFIENMRRDKSAPIDMKWLVRPQVPYAKIVQRDGKIVIRTTPNPLQGDKYWIHPGFRKYTFLERGLRKGRKAAAEALAAELVIQALKTHSLL